MPKISVIMPVYNAEQYLKESIDSILQQTFADFELIIIDDGSKDSSPAIVRSYEDPRIRFYVNEQNMGVARTLNRGLELAQGEYIARMDSDDISLPERFAKQVAFLDAHPSVAVCAAGVQLFGAQNGIRLFSASGSQLKVDLLFGNCFAHPTVMMRSSVVGMSGFHYDRNFDKMEDYALWVQVSRINELASIREVLLKYRVHPGQITQNYSDSYWEQNRSLKQILLEELGLTDKKWMDAFVLSDKKDLNRDELKAYLELLLQMTRANQSRRVYSEKILRNTVSSIVFQRLSGVPLGEARGLAHVAGLNGAFYSIKRVAQGSAYRVKAKLKIWRARSQLKNRVFTIISNNCWGGFIYQKYGLAYRTPTIGLFFLGDDYVKFCAKLDYYLAQPIQFIPWESARFYQELREESPFPVGKLDDIEVYFMHYHSEKEVLEKWERRKGRINWDKLIFKLSQRECCEKKDVEAFMALPIKNKVCFTYEEIPGTICIPELKDFRGDEMALVLPYFDELEMINRLD